MTYPLSSVNRTAAIIFLASVLCVSAAVAAPVAPADKDEILRHISIYEETTEHLDDIFRDFSDGYMTADAALKKVHLLQHEYDKLIDPVPPATEKLHELTLQLLSRVQNYFIYFKRANRENPELNLKIAETRFELHKELVKLNYEYL